MLKTASSITNAIGALNYKGTWDALTNNPTLTSGVGTKGDYYVVSVAGNTNLDGETLWGVGDLAVFNGIAWQKVDGGDTSIVTSLTVTSLTGYMYANGSNAVTASVTIPNSGLQNSSTVLGNATLTLGSTTTSVGNLTLTNVTASSGNVVGAIPNSSITNVLLANSSATLGNTTVTLGSTVSSVGNLTLTNANVASGNVSITYANVATAIRTQSLTGYLYGNANTGNVTASTTIPNAGLGNASTTLGNATLTLGSTTTSVGNLTLSNANITSVASTFPNSYLSNSTATLGNATITLGGTTTSVGNLTLSNVTISSGSVTSNNVNFTGTTNANATFATSSLLLVPEGYITVQIGGVNKKIPYYAV